MCDTESCCNLFSNYMGLVKEHIETVDKNMYSDLLSSPDQKLNNVAKNFMSGSVEVKKILKKFEHQWCPSKGHNDLKIKDRGMGLIDGVFDFLSQRFERFTRIGHRPIQAFLFCPYFLCVDFMSRDRYLLGIVQKEFADLNRIVQMVGGDVDPGIREAG